MVPVALLLVAIISLFLPAVARGQDAAQEEPQKRRTGLIWNNRPSLRFGDWLRVDFRIKVQGDARDFPREVKAPGGDYSLTRRRVGLEGTFLKGHFQYQIERELRDEDPWRDVFVNFRYFRDAQIQAGKFKIPFSHEQLTGAVDLDFVYRSRIAEDLAPARDIGGMVHGRFRVFGYEVGMFTHDGDQARFGTNPGAGPTGAVRITARPLRFVRPLRDLEIGAAATAGDVPEGLNTLRGRTVSGNAYFFDAYVKGRRLRLGAELIWEPGPVSLSGEYIEVRDERREQGLLGEDLPPLIARGWYASGTVVLTGEDKAGGVEPRRPLFVRGVGAIELAGRYERVRYGSDAPGEPPENNPRATNLTENGNRVWTGGINWYLNRWARIQLNAIHETIEDIERSPISGRNRFWTRVIRLQFVL